MITVSDLHTMVIRAQCPQLNGSKTESVESAVHMAVIRLSGLSSVLIRLSDLHLVTQGRRDLWWMWENVVLTQFTRDINYSAEHNDLSFP